MSAPHICRVCGEAREDHFVSSNFMGSLLLTCKTCKGRQLFTWEAGPKTAPKKIDHEHH